MIFIIPKGYITKVNPLLVGEGDWFHLEKKEQNPSEMGWVGFEPTTNALKGHCSSTELPTQTKRRGYVLPVFVTS